MQTTPGRRRGRGTRERLRRERIEGLPPPTPPIGPGLVGGAYRPFTDGDLRRLHEASLHILEHFGISEPIDAWRERVVEAGGWMTERGRLCFPPALVEDTIAGAARNFTLPGRDPKHDMLLSGSRTYYATSTAATAKPIITTFFRPESLEKAIALYDLSAGGDGDGTRFRRRPFACTTCTVVVSPLRFSPESLRVADTAVRNRIPLKVSTVSQAGATGPVSLAGNIALGNAEVLAGYVALNLLRPGCRLLYGNWPFVSDLRTGAFVGGGGEMALQMSGSAQLARHYDLPSTVAAAMTSAKVSDAQSGWEKGYLSTLPALAGANMIMMTMGGLADNVGYSPEALVIDESMLSGVLRGVRGIEVDDRTLAMESIERAIHGDGHFLGDGLTLEMMQSEFVYPKLADRQSIDAWLESGSPDIRSRAREIAREILARHYPTHIDPGDDARIRARFPILLPPEAMRPAG